MLFVVTLAEAANILLRMFTLQLPFAIFRCLILKSQFETYSTDMVVETPNGHENAGHFPHQLPYV
jgi:hypothetical protein